MVALGSGDIPPALATLGGLRTFQTPKSSLVHSVQYRLKRRHILMDWLTIPNWYGWSYFSRYKIPNFDLQLIWDRKSDNKCVTVNFSWGHVENILVHNFPALLRALKLLSSEQVNGVGWLVLARWDFGLSPRGDPGPVWPLKRQALCEAHLPPHS